MYNDSTDGLRLQFQDEQYKVRSYRIRCRIVILHPLHARTAHPLMLTSPIVRRAGSIDLR